jgi:integrase
VDKGTKNTEERDIPIWAPLYEVLQSLRGKKGLVCAAADGKKFSETAVKKAWGSYTNFLSEKQNGCQYRWAGKYLKAKGGQDAWMPCDIRMHDLRHTFCTMLYDAGVDVKRAQYLMGHKSLEVTMKIYTHLSEERKAKSDDAMGKYLKATVGKSVGKRKKFILKKL